jgi:hypothetical protein
VQNLGDYYAVRSIRTACVRGYVRGCVRACVGVHYIICRGIAKRDRTSRWSSGTLCDVPGSGPGTSPRCIELAARHRSAARPTAPSNCSRPTPTLDPSWQRYCRPRPCPRPQAERAATKRLLIGFFFPFCLSRACLGNLPCLSSEMGM